ncbi:ABC transporter permease [Clostridium oryzae]|uniref:ABC-2 family transporter protein n=1 Tax=Clostridium oryzae TaxID=1450648 RepID=A0A1V4ID23_9CLOT|nr:ABC transporter permease [Clostridium oryzae]OPJ57902.1 ABC-2 family transporter protein [Clostridium oryzae]
MINYIKAELYRNFNRKYFWLYTGIIVAAIVGLNLLLRASASGSNSYNLSIAMGLSVRMLTVPIFLAFVTLDFSILEEYKNLTMKNVLSFGLPRSTYILSKFIVSVFFSLLLALIVMVSFYGSTALLFGIGHKAGAITFSTLLSIIAASIPLWIASLAIGTFISVIISNPTIVSFVFAFLFLVGAQLVKLLYMLVSHNFIHVYNILITPQLGNFAVKFTSASIEKAVISGIIYTIVFIGLSIIIFNKKEIK